MHQQGDIVDDCPSCNQKQGVQYKSQVDGKHEAACVNCGEIFEWLDAEPTVATPPPTVASVAPAPAPPSAKPPDGLGSLKPVQVPPEPKVNLKLDPTTVADFGGDVPAYIRNSRAWRWAQVMGNTGNPYREGTKNNQIFALYAENPMTVEDCVVKCAQSGMNQKLSYLLTIYEVTAHCLSSGLLVMDPSSRKVSTCQGNPVPTKVT